MGSCIVPGCHSKLSDKCAKIACLYGIPASRSDPLTRVRRLHWLRALQLNRDKSMEHVYVCSRHFVSGHPVLDANNVDWVPSVNLQPRNISITDIITNLPEIKEEYDVPEYIILDKLAFNEQKIESDLIKYFTNPICDENGYYRYDHDYLGLPIVHIKTDLHCNEHKDHNYSTCERPACFYSDLRNFCNLCQCNTSNLFHFNMHMMKHTMRNDVTCQICRQKFLTTTCLNTHIETHFTICDMCGAEVPTVQLKAHQQPIQEQKERFSKNKLSQCDKVNFCIFCMKTFYKKKLYLAHLKHHRNAVGPAKKLKVIRKVIFAPPTTSI